MIDPVETRSCPTCATMPNFVALGQIIWMYVEGPKCFWTLGPHPLGRGRGLPLNMLFPHVIVPDFVAAGQTVFFGVGRGPKIFPDAEVPPLGMWVSQTPRNVLLPTMLPCQIRSYVKPYERNYGDLPENFDPSCPALEDHSRSLELTRIVATYDFLSVFHGTVFEIKGNIYLQNFVTHHIF